MNTEYLKTKARMTKKCTIKCPQCGLSSYNNDTDMGCNEFEIKYPEKAVAIVEKWGREHPVRTRQDDILKLFPNIDKINSGVIDLCPAYLGINIDCTWQSCDQCMADYWLTEVEA